MSIIHLDKQGRIAVITVDNPPVNAISQAVRQGLVDVIARISADGDVAAAVLHAAGRTFMAGADVKEFGKPPAPPTLPDVITVIESCAKPIVAAIHGQALGGGFEIALGCHYRVADANAMVGLPEVKLGLIPGAGGTQRLARLIAMEDALGMITSGDTKSAGDAHNLGILDHVCNDDLLKAAVAFAEKIADDDPASRRLSIRDANNPGADLFSGWREKLEKSRRGFDAPQACVDALEAAANLPFDQGIKRERELFVSMRESSQSKAQQHLFFAEREAAKIPGMGKDVNLKPVESAAIIGAGTMGGGIAMAFANAGIPVTLLEVSDEALDKGLSAIRKNFEGGVKRGKMSEAEVERRMGLIAPTRNYAALADADLVIEAVFEDFEIKKTVFQQLDKVCKPGAILATNTSYINVNDIAATTGRPEDVLGLHFFSPANIMKLLEVVRGDKTAPEVLGTTLKLAKRIGKIGVVSGVCHGFIGNRMYQCYQREAGLLLLEGASPTQVDKALYEFGLPMGPFALADLTGIDIGYMMRKSLTPDQFEARAFRVHDRLVEMGRKGQKTGAGFYTYEAGSRTPKDDGVAMDIIRGVVVEEDMDQRAIPDDEIIERCIYAMVNEGARILEEGIAYRASDIDVIYANGYGFPRFRGGPMFYAQLTGLDHVLEAVRGFAGRFGPRWWQPPELFVRAAGKGRWSE